MKINWINIGVKIFAIIFILVGFILKAVGIFDVSVTDLIAVGGAMVAVFFPVDASKIAKAIRGEG